MSMPQGLIWRCPPSHATLEAKALQEPLSTPGAPALLADIAAVLQSRRDVLMRYHRQQRQHRQRNDTAVDVSGWWHLHSEQYARWGRGARRCEVSERRRTVALAKDGAFLSRHIRVPTPRRRCSSTLSFATWGLWRGGDRP